MSNVDHIIIGRGLAGVVLSESLIKAGRSVLIFDQPKDNSASEAAGGSINPISFKRLILSWKAKDLLAAAIPFYQYLEGVYGRSLIESVPALRIHASQDEARLWTMRMLEEPIGQFLDQAEVPEKVIAPFGCGSINSCYRLHVQVLLEAHGDSRSDMIRNEEVRVVEKKDTGYFLVNGVQAKSVIHCKGPFHELPGLVPVQGEVLVVRIPGLNLKSSLHRGCFLLPKGNDEYLLGSTFEWKKVWSGPTEEGRNTLLSKLRRITELPYEVVEHWAGTRPTTRDRRPIIGEHPLGSGEFVFNGLGSRGALLAPWCATRLVEHIVSQAAIPADIDSDRFQ